MDVRILIVQAIAFCGVRATGIQSVTNPEGCKSQNQGVRREDRADDYGQPASDIAIMAVRSVKTILPATRPHWVGDGFNVYPTFADLAFTNEISPFLMFDYAKPKEFPRTKKKLGVGKHPHRGIVTVTLAMQGEVEHGDNVGNSGVIGTGDVQWMSAGRGIVHEEYHSRKFASTGGMFEMCQLWLNLPASHKMSKPTYQPILEAEIPVVPVIGETVDDACVHIICGEYNGTKGIDLTRLFVVHSYTTDMVLNLTGMLGLFDVAACESVQFMTLVELCRVFQYCRIPRGECGVSEG
eukprot:m.1205231 g.1205231  ORF g.1205231 m.1205231 type:complete len:295 (-) comp24582_c0_seq18:5407-6291(-)